MWLLFINICKLLTSNKVIFAINNELIFEIVISLMIQTWKSFSPSTSSNNSMNNRNELLLPNDFWKLNSTLPSLDFVDWRKWGFYTFEKFEKYILPFLKIFFFLFSRNLLTRLQCYVIIGFLRNLQNFLWFLRVLWTIKISYKNN